MVEIVKSQLWPIGIVLSCFVAFMLAGLIISSPCWWAVCSGWGVVALNSMLARVINARATGVARPAFVGWGIVANAIRMLTLAVIFAYMTLNYINERGSFLIAGFSAFFILMPVEVVQLFSFQSKAVSKFECGRHAN